MRCQYMSILCIYIYVYIYIYISEILYPLTIDRCGFPYFHIKNACPSRLFLQPSTARLSQGTSQIHDPVHRSFEPAKKSRMQLMCGCFLNFAEHTYIIYILHISIIYKLHIYHINVYIYLLILYGFKQRCDCIPPVLEVYSAVIAEILRFDIFVSPSDQSWGSQTCDPRISKADRWPRDTVAAMAAWSNPKDIRRLWISEFLAPTLRTEDKHPWNFIYIIYAT